MTALAVVQQPTPTSIAEYRELSVQTVSRDRLDLLKNTVARGADDLELELFFMQCNRTKLDPFLRQIYCIKRYDAETREKRMAMQIGIDGFRLTAQRTGEYNGQEGPFWCGADGQWRDLWVGSAPPVAAKVAVYRKGWDRPVWGVALWDEYVQTKRDGDVTRMWSDRPAGQLAKCAEALAFRKAFPMELSGLYSEEELARDAERTGEDAAALPRTQDPRTLALPGEVGKSWGGYAGTPLEKCPASVLKSFDEWCRKNNKLADYPNELRGIRDLFNDAEYIEREKAAKVERDRIRAEKAAEEAELKRQEKMDAEEAARAAGGELAEDEEELPFSAGVRS